MKEKPGPEEIKRGIEALAAGFKNERREKNREPAQKMVESLDLNDPSKFYFDHRYPGEQMRETALELKLLQEGRKIDWKYTRIFLNYTDIEDTVAEIIKKCIGYTCSVDKARNVVRTIMSDQLNKTEKPTKFRKGFWDPKMRNRSTWEKLVFNHPSISASRIMHFLLACEEVFAGYERVARQEVLEALNFERFVRERHAELLNKKVTKKDFTYGDLFSKNRVNAMQWVAYKEPHVMAHYRNDRKHGRL